MAKIGALKSAIAQQNRPGAQAWPAHDRLNAGGGASAPPLPKSVKRWRGTKLQAMLGAMLQACLRAIVCNCSPVEQLREEGIDGSTRPDRRALAAFAEEARPACGGNRRARTTAACREESDSLGAWLDESCLLSPAVKVQAVHLYNDYRAYTEARGASAMNMTRWGQRMGDRGFRKEKGRQVQYYGIGLRDTCDSCDTFSQTSPSVVS
jgi:hypothetical protein